MVAGLIKPDEGQVLLGGKRISESWREYRKRIGICPQENVHWKRLTPAEQLRFLGEMYGIPRKVLKKRIPDLMERLGITEDKDRLVGKLSGGMQRRLNIALALIHDPDLLILDEPEAGLDPQSRINIRQFIKSLSGIKTIILTTHNMDEADRLADRLAIMDRGELLVIDRPEALKNTVGEGDVLEITLDELPDGLDPGKLALVERARVTIDQDRIFIRALDLPNMLPMIVSRLDDLDLQVLDIRLRKNTLEDVFMHMTGRRLQG
jgi:ABC-2 type transport system ATP-binding protein